MTEPRLVDALRARMRGPVEVGRPLASLTTYRLGGPARVYAEPADLDDLEVFASVLAETGDVAAVLPVGRGSNLVVSDRGWPGIVLRLGPGFAACTVPDPASPERLLAGAATPLPSLANRAVRRGLSGLEWAIAVPGSVGGALRMNAGAHGRDVASVLADARVYDLARGALATRPASELGLGYRRSNLTDSEIVIDATFALRAGDGAEIRARMDSYRRHRAATQPGAAQNAGSTFRNPPGDAAGRLVEAAALKGFTVGGASVSGLHANFFMAGPGATAQDVYDLVQEVGRRVLQRFGVELEPEVRFVGSFARVAHTHEAEV